MELNRKHIAIVLVVLFLGSVGAVGVAIAQTPANSSWQRSSSTSPPAAAGGYQMAPINPAFTQYTNDKAAGRAATKTSDGKGLGLTPIPLDLSHVNAGKGSDYAGTYPASYDLRTKGKVSPVGDQGDCGNCWTFATYGSLESYLRPGSTTTYSEKAMNKRHGFSDACCDGGNWLMSTAYLTRWGTMMKGNNGGTIYAGPVTASCDPFTTPYCTDAKTCSIAKHVQQVVMLPGRTSSLDNNAIKYGLTHYGALYVAFQWEGDGGDNPDHYWNPNTAAYYDDTTAEGNHAVTIVGWNDNFPASSFSTRPAGNGAFICKNEWSAWWGESGYFYVSYYDKNFGYSSTTPSSYMDSNNAVAFTAQSNTNHKTNYQYDPFGWCSNVGRGTSTVWAANTYTAKAGTLKAVGFYAPVKNTAYTIRIYKNPTSTNPSSGTLVTTKTGSVAYVGYYTSTLLKSVPLTAGQKFSVVIKYYTPGYNYPSCVTRWIDGYDDNIPKSVVGHSFISKTGASGSWSDLAKIYSPTYGVANDIHAYAS